MVVAVAGGAGEDGPTGAWLVVAVRRRWQCKERSQRSMLWSVLCNSLFQQGPSPSGRASQLLSSNSRTCCVRVPLQLGSHPFFARMRGINLGANPVISKVRQAWMRVQLNLPAWFARVLCQGAAGRKRHGMWLRCASWPRIAAGP